MSCSCGLEAKLLAAYREKEFSVSSLVLRATRAQYAEIDRCSEKIDVLQATQHAPNCIAFGGRAG